MYDKKYKAAVRQELRELQAEKHKDNMRQSQEHWNFTMHLDKRKACVKKALHLGKYT